MSKVRIALLSAGFVLIFMGVAQMVIMVIHGRINATDRHVSIGLMVAGTLLAIVGGLASRRKTTGVVKGMTVRWKTTEELGELVQDPAYAQPCVPELQSYGKEGRLTIHSEYMSDRWGRRMVTLERDGVVITAKTVILGVRRISQVEFDPDFFLPL